jgi:hypothetical protein
MIQSTRHSNIQLQNALGSTAPLPRHLSRWLAWEQALLLALTMCFWGAFLVRQTSVVGFGYSRDFLGVYAGARAVATGRGPQLYDVQVQRALMDTAILPYRRGKLMPFIYPAYVALLFRPLGGLPFGPALLTWLLINLATAAWTATRLSYLFARSLPERLAILVTFFAWVPLQLTLFHGQLGILPTLGIIEALVAVRSGRDWRAGWWLSLGLLKPQLILFPLLVFIIWRRWQTVLAFSIAVAGILGISIAAIGFWVAKYARFLAECARRGPELSVYPGGMQNWRGLVYSLLKTDDGLASRSALLALSFISILMVFLICYQPRSSPSSDQEFRLSAVPHGEARYATAVLLGLLSSPHLYMHDWVVALPAGFVLWCFAREPHSKACSKKFYAAALLWLLGLAPMVFFAAQFIRWPEPQPIQLVPVYVAVLVAVAVVILGSVKRIAPTQ